MAARYECDCCAACCRGTLLVEADIVDALREPRLLQADAHYASRPAAEALEVLDEPGRCLLIAGGTGACPFLDPENRCSIYPTRPHACVAMQAGDEQCQEARRAADLPPLEPVAE